MSKFTARRLKEIRVAHNMSQDEAAKALNISIWQARMKMNKHNTTIACVCRQRIPD